MQKHLFGHFLMKQDELGLINLELINLSHISDTKISKIMQYSVEKLLAAKNIQSPMSNGGDLNKD